MIRRRLLPPWCAALVMMALVCAFATTGSPAVAHAVSTESSSTATAPAPSWTPLRVAQRADIRVHKVTIALVAPQNTTPDFTADDARRALKIADDFYNRETGGAIRFEVEQLVDWTPVDAPIACSDTGALHDWVTSRIGWSRQPARHLVVMVPNGDPCPGWANGEQGGDPDDGGRTFQPGAQPSTLVHELGHNLSLAHASSVHCTNGWDYLAESAALPTGCSREEYGHRMDVMGGSSNIESFSAPAMARLGLLPGALEPACGASRTATVDSAGSGFDSARALTWTDPENSAARYWVEYRDAADADRWDDVAPSPWGLEPDPSGVQILRTNPGVPFGADLLERPGDSSDARQFVRVGEEVRLAHGMTVRVDAHSPSARQATVTVTVPCVRYEGDIAGLATPTASYASEWAPAASAIDASPTTLWGTWPRIGEQTLDLAWPVAVTVDRVGVRFAADTADAASSGLIPPRSWTVEARDGNGSWVTVPSIRPVSPGRERDVVNTVGFAPVRTTAIRLRFTAWGNATYAGSTGVSDVEVFTADPSPLLVAYGSQIAAPVGTTTEISAGVTVIDNAGAPLAGRDVSFTLEGSATFADGSRQTVVSSGADGRSSAPRVMIAQTAGTSTLRASVAGSTPMVVMTITGVPPRPVATIATASTAAVGGRIALTVAVTNTGTSTTTITLTTSFGTKILRTVRPGQVLTTIFSTGRVTVPAGTVRVFSRDASASETVVVGYSSR